MPLALIAIAILVILTGVKGNYAAVGAQFDTDVVGSQGFISFLIGIVGIAVFFRLLGLPNVGRFFLALVIVVYLIQNSTLLNTLASVANYAAPTSATTATATTATTATATPSTTQ